MDSGYGSFSEKKITIFSFFSFLYQPVEKRYQLTRRALQLLYGYKLLVSVLTKPTLVKRDVDILKDINELKINSVFMFTIII